MTDLERVERIRETRKENYLASLGLEGISTEDMKEFGSKEECIEYYSSVV